MKRRNRRCNYDYLDTAVHGIVSSLNKQYTRTDKILLDSGFCDTVTWGALKKSWKGYKIAKSEFDYKMMEYYAMGIRKFQRELNVSVIEFPQKMPHERDPENAFYSYSYDQTQRELEDYELQLNQEQELDPYITEQEPNLLREQAEYNKRIRWEMFGAYFEW